MGSPVLGAANKLLIFTLISRPLSIRNEETNAFAQFVWPGPGTLSTEEESILSHVVLSARRVVGSAMRQSAGFASSDLAERPLVAV